MPDGGIADRFTRDIVTYPGAWPLAQFGMTREQLVQQHRPILATGEAPRTR
ncbi:hypothetical protein [Mycobacterium sp. GA-2829]|uniref:hypothetical protein n=1 Tax=Mycobacterium sp. GA-2829 TaxID=1772283 RepID=UPI000A8ADC83|nr:hypothetical protein [Mycobacterium sp. GA-2829]